MPWREPTSVAATEVTTVELFLDLVFVFTITQVAGLLEHDLTLTGAGQALLVFGVLWWMYGGYIWLTNQAPPRHGVQQALLFVGMAGFMITAISIPHAFGATGVYLGVGYLIVVAVHGALFTRVGPLRGLALLVPGNLLAAGLILIAGVVGHGPVVYVLWALAIVLLVIITRLPGTPRFNLGPDHLVERYGSLVIIALGETVAATGLGIDADHLSPSVVVALLLGLALPGVLWWSYFSGDDEAAVRALERETPARRGVLALAAYFYAHIPIMLGVIVSTVGVREVIADPVGALEPAAALALAGGVALFFLGDTRFRRVLALGPVRPRLVLAALALLTWPIGHWGVGSVQLTVLVVLIAAVVVLERRAVRDAVPA